MKTQDCNFKEQLVTSMMMGAALALIRVPVPIQEETLESLANLSVRLAEKIHDKMHGSDPQSPPPSPPKPNPALKIQNDHPGHC